MIELAPDIEELKSEFRLRYTHFHSANDDLVAFCDNSSGPNWKTIRNRSRNNTRERIIELVMLIEQYEMELK